MDAAVFTSTIVKRFNLLLAIAASATMTVIAHLDSMDESNIVNKPENRICYSFVYSGCQSAFDIESGMMKIVTMFFMKMLFHDIWYPSCFMTVTRRVEYNLTLSTTTYGEGEGGESRRKSRRAVSCADG